MQKNLQDITDSVLANLKTLIKQARSGKKGQEQQIAAQILVAFLEEQLLSRPEFSMAAVEYFGPAKFVALAGTGERPEIN